MVYAVSTLGFPPALLAEPVAGALGVPAGMVGAAVLWGVGTCVGYAQWFVIIPYLRRALVSGDGIGK